MSLPPMLDPVRFESVVHQYKTDPESVYHTWFINSGDRLKAFRAIRRGVEQIVTDIKLGSLRQRLSRLIA